MHAPSSPSVQPQNSAAPTRPRWLHVAYWTWLVQGLICLVGGFGAIGLVQAIEWMRSTLSEHAETPPEVTAILPFLETLAGIMERSWLLLIILGVACVGIAWVGRHGKRWALHVMNALGIIHLLMVIPWAAYESIILGQAAAEFSSAIEGTSTEPMDDLQQALNFYVQIALYIGMFVYVCILLYRANTAEFKEQCAQYVQELSGESADDDLNISE